MRKVQQLAGFVSTAEAAAAPYRYLPFEVPPRCTRIDVSYHFYSDGGPSTVDIGLFDIRGTEPLTGGFRGWSGSARRSFSIERESATPGYLAGPLPSGTWWVSLGLYSVPEPGVRWFVTVEVESARDEPPAVAPSHPSQREPVPADDGRLTWIPGDLHSHSEHSDGANTVAEIAAFALQRGLRYLAITDHNTITHHNEVDAFHHPGLLLIPGEEVTTNSGHANVWGLREWVDFRVTADEEMHRLFRWVESRRRPFSINHPKSVGPPWLWTDPGFRIREVWQAPWRWFNWQSVQDWDALLADGERITPVGGSDAHSVPPAEPMHPHHIGDPTTWLQVRGVPTEAKILEAITAGRTAISDGPEGPRVHIVPGDNEDSLAIETHGAKGCTLVLVVDGEQRYRTEVTAEGQVIPVPGDIRHERYIRAELRTPPPEPGGHEDTRALSAPVYRE
ncbi:MAG TPA: CehA/McbA family metallohydrolase [Tepidiformaceae bacterium]